MEKLGKLPPRTRLCRGKDCSGAPCKEEEPGFPYSHFKDLAVCPKAAHTPMANRYGCYLWHMWPARKRAKKPAQALAKNSGRGPWAGDLGRKERPPKESQHGWQPQQPAPHWETPQRQRQRKVAGRDPAAPAAGHCVPQEGDREAKSHSGGQEGKSSKLKIKKKKKKSSKRQRVVCEHRQGDPTSTAAASTSTSASVHKQPQAANGFQRLFRQE
jgi:hypothetical protein